MADDETIRIQVDGAQAQAQLKALEEEVRNLEKELEELNNTAGVTNAEINGTTRNLEAAREKFDAASEAAEKFKNETEGSAGAAKGLIEQVGGAVNLLALITGTFVASYKATRKAIEALKDYGIDIDAVTAGLWEQNESFQAITKAILDYNTGAKETTDTTQELANANNILTKRYGESYDSIEEARAALERHARAAYDDAKALEAASNAVFGNTKKLAEQEQQTVLAVNAMLALGTATDEQTAKARDAVQSLLDRYKTAGVEIPSDLQKIADAIGVSSSLQEKALKDVAKEEEALEKAAVKSSEARAKAEQKAADEIVAALEKERVALDKKLAEDEARLAKALDKGRKLDDSVDTTEAQKNLKDLKDEISDLESQPVLDQSQINKLDDLKNRAANAARSMGDLNKVFTVTRDDFLDQEEAADAAAAAWDVYRDRVDKTDRVMSDLARTTDDFGGDMEDFGDTTSDAADSMGELGDAAEDLGDKAKDGTTKAKEGLENLKEGAEEVIPLLETIKGLLGEIQAAAAAVDL